MWWPIKNLKEILPATYYEVGFGPADTVLYGDPAHPPHGKRHAQQPPQLFSSLLWPASTRSLSITRIVD